MPSLYYLHTIKIIIMVDLYCNPVTGNILQQVCELLKGGVAQEIFVANLGEIDSVAYNPTTGELDTITMKVNPITTPDLFNWYRIISKKQTAGLTNTIKKGTNTSYIEQALTFIVPGMDTVNKKAFETMVTGQAVFIVKDSTGRAHIVGEKSGAEVQDGGTMGTGVALDDLVGMNVTFIANENFATHTVEAGTTIEVLEADGTTISTVTL